MVDLSLKVIESRSSPRQPKDMSEVHLVHQFSNPAIARARPAVVLACRCTATSRLGDLVAAYYYSCRLSRRGHIQTLSLIVRTKMAAVFPFPRVYVGSKVSTDVSLAVPLV